MDEEDTYQDDIDEITEHGYLLEAIKEEATMNKIAHVEWNYTNVTGRMWYNDSPSDVFDCLYGYTELGYKVAKAMREGYTIVQGMPEED